MSDPSIVYVSGTTEAVKVTSSGAIDLVEVTTTYGGGSGGGGAVDSVNGKTGVVVLDAADVGAAEVINVKDFGAVGDGVADDWLAIQKAIYHASWQWQTPGWPATEDFTEENWDTLLYDITVDGNTYAIPRIWAGQGHQKVYLPTPSVAYRTTRALVITHSTALVGERAGQVIIQPDQAMREACIITKNLAINLMHPATAFNDDQTDPLSPPLDTYNACAYLADFQIRRKLAGSSTPTAAVGNLTEWFAHTSDKLAGTAGATTLVNTPNRGRPLAMAGTELPIRLAHEVELFGDLAQIYTIVTTNATNTVITPALVTSTPVGGSMFLVGIPAIKGIFASGGEDFLIERVDTFLDHSAVGMMIVGGSPGPSIRNCMSSQNKVGFWVDNYPASLDCISGDDNEVFVKSGCLRWSNLTILNYKCETNRGDLFQFGGFYGTDPTIYNIVGGAANASDAAEVSGSAVFHVFLPNAANPGGFPIINSSGSRPYINRTRMLKTTDRYGGFTVTSLDIPKASTQDYPPFLCWNKRSATLGGIIGIPAEAQSNSLTLPYYNLPTGTGYLALSDSASGVDSLLANATDAATPSTIAKRDVAGNAAFVGVTASTINIQASSEDFLTFINNQGSQSADRAQFTADADGIVALTGSATGVPDKLAGGTISGVTTVDNGATWSYFSSTQSDAHLTALGGGTAGIAVLKATTAAAAATAAGVGATDDVAFLSSSITATTASTTPTTGALKVAGGAGIAGNINAGGTVTVGGTNKLFAQGDYGGTGEIPQGALIGNYSGGGFGFFPSIASVTAGARIVFGYWAGGIGGRSAVEVANTASGNGTLLLMKSGGKIGVGNSSPGATLDVTGTIRPGIYTVATTPATAANGMVTGASILVTDAEAPVIGSAVASGAGTDHLVECMYNGTNWIVTAILT